MIDLHPAPRPPRITLDPLKTFSASEIVLNKQEAWFVLAYFFDHPGIRAEDLTENDLSFAQALVIEGIEQSYGVNFLWPNKPIYLAKEMSRIVTAVLQRTQGNWNWTAALAALLKYPELHYLVRTKLSNRYVWQWIARVKANIPAY